MAIVRADSIRTIAAAGISGTYAALGAPLAHNWRTFKVTNMTDGDILISLDATTDNFFVPAGGFTLYDLSTNSPPISELDNFVMGINSQFYVKESTSATTKDVWLEGIYAKGE